MTKTIKTIDINAKEWFDKVNGNSYFSAVITLNYGMPDEENISLPFQYGYGDHYIDMANEYLQQNNIIPKERYENGLWYPIRQYCRENDIILRTNKKDNCLKRELTKAKGR